MAAMRPLLAAQLAAIYLPVKRGISHMKYTLPLYLFIIGIYSGGAYAADVSGTIGLGGQYLDARGDKAKFNEYNDIGTGVIGNINLDSYVKQYYLSLEGQNIGWNRGEEAGLNNQQYSLKGGVYGSYKYSLFYDETPHNITFNAKSAYNGIGGIHLTNDVSNLVLPLTNFDYRTKRTTFGGGIEASFNTPFFFSVKADRSEVKGILPTGFSPSSFESALELPSPVNYSTDNLYVETGYRTKQIIFKIDATFSEFENHNGPWLTLDQPVAFGGATPGVVTLPPDNTYYKVGGSLIVKQLPLSSIFMVRGNYSRLDNSQNLFETSQNYKGNIHYTSIATALTSNPIAPLNLRLFYNYFDRDNQSTLLATYGTDPTSRFDYTQQSAGIDAGYRLPARTKVDVGYEYQQVTRSRDDGTKTRDHIAYAQVKNSFLDWMSAKLRYQHLIRKSDTVSPASLADPIDQFYVDNFRRFDVADKTEDKVKLGIELTPLDNLSFGIEYNFKLNNYDTSLLGATTNHIDASALTSLLGIQSDTRHELSLDANYAISIVKLNGYVDMEFVERKMKAHELDLETFNWSSDRKDRTYACGLKADIDIIKNILSAKTGWRYEKTHGSNDFSYPGTVVTPPQNISALDNFERQTFNLSFAYQMTKQMLMSLGYMYERLKYNDNAWNGYQLANTDGAGGGAPGVFLTGAYANPNYQAHLGFLKLSYSF